MVKPLDSVKASWRDWIRAGFGDVVAAEMLTE